MVCPLCQSVRTRLWWGQGGVQYKRCLGCDTIYPSSPPGSAEHQARLVENYAYHAGTLRLASSRRAALEGMSANLQAYKNHGAYLDIGCGIGSAFEFYDPGVWRLFGVEISPTAAEYAAETCRASVCSGALREANYPNEHFDLVSMLDVFYYIRDPIAELKEVRRIIKPDGLLAIENFGQRYMLLRSRGVVCWLMEHRWTRLAPDSNILHLSSPRGLQRLVEANGFRLVAQIVVDSSGKPGIAGRVIREYAAVIRLLARRWPAWLTWAPKYLMLAEPA